MIEMRSGSVKCGPGPNLSEAHVPRVTKDNHLQKNLLAASSHYLQEVNGQSEEKEEELGNGEEGAGTYTRDVARAAVP